MSEQPSSGTKVESLLQRFPGPVALGDWTKNNPVPCLFFLMLTALSVPLIVGGNGNDSIVGWVMFALCCSLTVVSAIQALPNSAGLTLNADGIQQRRLFITIRSLWQEASDFTVAPIISPFSGTKVASIIWYHDQRRERWWLSRLWKGRFNAGIPQVEELSIEQLADLINRWREKALAHESLPPPVVVPDKAPVGLANFKLPWAAVSIVGAILFVASAGIVISNFWKYHVAPQSLPSNTSALESQSNSFSDHGPGRVSCDEQWSDLHRNGLQIATRSYADFMRNCMKNNLQ